jgi:hypothetical protein
MEHNSSQQNRHRPALYQNRKINVVGDIMGTFAQIGAICSSGTRGTTCIAVCPQHASVPSATVAIRPNRTAKNAYSDYSGPSNYAQFNPHFDYQRAFIRGWVGQYLDNFAVAQPSQRWPREKTNPQAPPDQPNKTAGLEHRQLVLDHKP